ncbi:hypothetical protein FO519_000593 [Halicephalobus sp. NKZ332]|nr:hypothetical protein FO519_000593 [Halicephalobus sp. NKZ332]
MRGGRGGFAKREHRPIPEEGPYRSFVGNLPADTIQGDFDTLFSGLRINTVHMIRDKETDRFKGFAYVEFSTREELERALEIDGAEFDGRFVRVDVADNRDNRDNRPKQRSNRSPRGGRRRRASDTHGGDRPHRPSDHKGKGDHKVSEFHRPNDEHRAKRGDRFRGQPMEQSGPPLPDPSRPKLNLQPRTTDPEELERRRRKDEEEPLGTANGLLHCTIYNNGMTDTLEVIEKKLRDELETDVVSVKDLSDGCGAKYEILVAANKFQGMSILKRHKLIHQICQDELKFTHAITLHTYSLEEYNKSVELQLPKKKYFVAYPDLQTMVSKSNDTPSLEDDQIKKYFDSATFFYRNHAHEIRNNDAHLRFYGFYKVVTEGPLLKNSFRDYMTFDRKRKSYVNASKYSKREAMIQYYELMEELNVGWSKENYQLFVKPVIRPSTLANSVIKQNTPLEKFITAVRIGDTKEVLRITEQEPDLLRKTDETGGTALHWAADADQDKMIELLINLRFFVDAQDNQGQTPIHIAAYCENLKAIRELLRCGASLHVVDHDGETPIEVFNETPSLLRCLDLYELYPITT